MVAWPRKLLEHAHYTSMQWTHTHIHKLLWWCLVTEEECVCWRVHKIWWLTITVQKYTLNCNWKNCELYFIESWITNLTKKSLLTLSSWKKTISWMSSRKWQCPLWIDLSLEQLRNNSDSKILDEYYKIKYFIWPKCETRSIILLILLYKDRHCHHYFPVEIGGLY